MTSPDYPDYRKGVVAPFVDVLLFNLNSGFGNQLGTGGMDVSQFSTLDISLVTTSDASGDIWTMIVQWNDANDDPVAHEVYSFIGSSDVPTTNASNSLSLPVRGTKAYVTIIPTGNGLGILTVLATNRQSITPRIKGGAFFTSDLGAVLASTPIAVGAQLMVPIGTTSDLLDVRTVMTGTVGTVSVQAWAAGAVVPAWQNVYTTTIAQSPLSLNGLVVPDQALRLVFTNNDTVSRNASATAWAAR